MRLPLCAAALVAICGGAAAQSGVPAFPVTGEPPTRSVQISVSYQFFLSGDVKTAMEQTALADEGRRQLYQLFSRECDVMLDTIAMECALERANVSTNLIRNRGAQQDGLQISGSATYKVTMKPSGREAGDVKPR